MSSEMCLRQGHDYPQGLRDDANFDRSHANWLAIGINLERALSRNMQTRRLKILNIGHAQMFAAEQGWEASQQPQPPGAPDKPRVQHAILELRARRDAHS